MKTKEEINVLKEEVENLRRILAELTDDELAEVCGGVEEFSTCEAGEDKEENDDNDESSPKYAPGYGPKFDPGYGPKIIAPTQHDHHHHHHDDCYLTTDCMRHLS